MAKIRVKSGGSNGGLFGSGIFGVLGGVVTCDSKDESYYCRFMKFVTFILYFFLLVAIFYLVYQYLSQSGFRILPKSLYRGR